MKTLRQIHRDFTAQLPDHYTPAEKNWLFHIFLEAYHDLHKTDFFLNPGRMIDESKMTEALERLKRNEPWQYILGHTEFYGLTLAVDSRVLIPRPETEELIDVIKNRLPFYPANILDIGTGSGAIALALKKIFPQAEVTAMDFKPEILDLVRQNADYNQLKINLFQGNILQNEFPAGPWDLVVSNPPYVLTKERGKMEANVLDYEPAEALFVPDDDPLVYYRKITAFFLEAGSDKSRLFFEINPGFRESLGEMAANSGLSFVFHNDSAGKVRMMETGKSI